MPDVTECSDGYVPPRQEGPDPFATVDANVLASLFLSAKLNGHVHLLTELCVPPYRAAQRLIRDQHHPPWLQLLDPDSSPHNEAPRRVPILILSKGSRGRAGKGNATRRIRKHDTAPCYS